jgi:drug/metabolite transporter (DMT)-like permease
MVLLAFWAHGFGAGLALSLSPWFLVAGGIGFGLGGWCVFQALRRIGSTLSLLVVECGATIFATAIAWSFLGASLSVWEVVLVSLMLTGVIIGMTPGPLPNLDRKTLLTGCGFALAASLFQAMSFNLSRHAFNLLRDAGESIPLASASYQRLCGGLLVAVSLYAIGRFSKNRKTIHPETHASPLPAPVWVFFNALFGPVLGVSCMLWAISLVENPGLVQSVAASSTLLTVPLAYKLEQARPKWSYYLGCTLALGAMTGLFLIVR